MPKLTTEQRGVITSVMDSIAAHMAELRTLLDSPIGTLVVTDTAASSWVLRTGDGRYAFRGPRIALFTGDGGTAQRVADAFNSTAATSPTPYRVEPRDAKAWAMEQLDQRDRELEEFRNLLAAPD